MQNYSITSKNIYNIFLKFYININNYHNNNIEIIYILTVPASPLLSLSSTSKSVNLCCVTLWLYIKWRRRMRRRRRSMRKLRNRRWRSWEVRSGVVRLRATIGEFLSWRICWNSPTITRRISSMLFAPTSLNLNSNPSPTRFWFWFCFVLFSLSPCIQLDFNLQVKVYGICVAI